MKIYINPLVKCEFCNSRFSFTSSTNKFSYYCNRCRGAILFDVDDDEYCLCVSFYTYIKNIKYQIVIDYKLNKSIIRSNSDEIILDFVFSFNFLKQKESINYISEKISKLLVFK